jgi:hypothetical protein
MSTMTKEELEMYGSDQLTWDLENVASNDLFAKELLDTPVGREIVANKLRTNDNIYAIVGLAQERAGRVEITIREAEAAAKELFLAGDLKPRIKPVAQAPAPKQLSASQQAWSEFRQWSESHTSEQCKQRARSEKAFGDFYRKNLEREFGNTQVGDAVVNVNQKAPTTKKSVPEDVATYAARYRTMSSDAVRKEMSPGVNPLGPAAAAEASRLFELACQYGLI